jgi:hypothetical protein
MSGVRHRGQEGAGEVLRGHRYAPPGLAEGGRPRADARWHPGKSVRRPGGGRCAQRPAHILRLQLQTFEVSAPAEILDAFAAMERSGVRAVLLRGWSTPSVLPHTHHTTSDFRLRMTIPNLSEM